jgi:hypothetical protein
MFSVRQERDFQMLLTWTSRFKVLKKKVVSALPLDEVCADLPGLCPPMQSKETIGWGTPPSNSRDTRVMVSKGDLHPPMGFEPWETPNTPHIPQVLSSTKMKVSIFEQTNLHIHLVRDWTTDLLNESPAWHLETTNSQFTNTCLHATKLHNKWKTIDGTFRFFQVSTSYNSSFCASIWENNIYVNSGNSPSLDTAVTFTSAVSRREPYS